MSDECLVKHMLRVRRALRKSNRRVLLQFFGWLLADFIKIRDFNSEECSIDEISEDAREIMTYCKDQVWYVIFLIDRALDDVNGVYVDRWCRAWESGICGFGWSVPIGDPSSDREAICVAQRSSLVSAHISRFWWKMDGPDGPDLDAATDAAEEAVESAIRIMKGAPIDSWKAMADKLIELTKKYEGEV